ncbi:MAG: hypothetical protein AAB562_04900 [Patescibacteria group bacterium]
MSETTTRNGNKVVRIGLLSRIDYGSDGFRQGLLNLAAETFKLEDVHLVILAGGLVSGREVEKKTKQLKKELKVEEKALKIATAALASCAYEIEDLEQESSRTATEQKRLDHLRKEQPKFKQERDRQARVVGEIEQKLEDLKPEHMADDLAECLPRFTNAKGKPVKLYIVYSEAYDKEVGRETGRSLLNEKHGRDDLRFYEEEASSFPLWPGEPDEKKLEVLTASKNVWMRGDYFSTSVERLIKDRTKQTASESPDFRVIGCFGSSILKPKGEARVSYVSVPVLHRLEGTTVNENQIGVQVMIIDRDRPVPTLRDYPWKDLIKDERAFITGNPAKTKPDQITCLEVLKNRGKKMTTGGIAEATGLTREQVVKALKPLMVKKGDRPRKTWPGLSYDERSDRWDFFLEWVKRYLQHKLPEGERKTDSSVQVCCVHAASLDTDYFHLLEAISREMLAHDANILVNAGDSIEGLAHNMLECEQVYGGFIITRQEMLAGILFSEVILKVFKVRFEKLLEGKNLKNLSKEETVQLVLTALVTYIYIMGNHDLWAARTGHTPLVKKIDTMVERLVRHIEKILIEKGLRVDGLTDLVKSRIVSSPKGRFTLPSGLNLAVMHPHMARAKTTSLRPQEMLDKASDCQVVFGGNFHVGETLGQWEAELGQRVCVEIGTMKHRSDFEDHKLKTVDQGFARSRIVSVNGRIVFTEATYYSNSGRERLLDNEMVFNGLLAHLGITL